MKKILLSWAMFFLLLGGTAHADHWVFIETENKAAPDISNDIGLAKRGDIIRIRPVLCEEEYCEPTPTEKSKFAILRVSGLTDKDIENLTAPYEDNTKVLKPVVRRQVLKDGKLVEADPLDQSDTNPDTYKIVANRQRAVNLGSNGLNVSKGSFSKVAISKGQLISAVRVKTEVDLAFYKVNSIRYAWFERPIRIAMNKITPPAHAANVSKICAVGANCTDEDYNDLQTWEAAVNGDLVTATAGETAELYDDDGPIEGDVIVDGSTTNATYFITMTAASGEEHGGDKNSGATVTDDGAGECWEVKDDYTVTSNLVCDSPSSHGYAGDSGASGFHTVSNVIIDSPGGRCFSFWIEANYTVSGFCIDPGGYGLWNNSSTTGNQYVVNYSSYGAGDQGLVSQNNSLCVENTAVFNSTTRDYGDGDINTGCSDNYASSDTTGQSGLQSLTATDEFVSVTDGSEDLHLKAGSNLISAGATPTPSDAPSTDIDGTSRPVDTYDIGADEFESAAAPSFFPRVIVF